MTKETATPLATLTLPPTLSDHAEAGDNLTIRVTVPDLCEMDAAKLAQEIHALLERHRLNGNVTLDTKPTEEWDVYRLYDKECGRYYRAGKLFETTSAAKRACTQDLPHWSGRIRDDYEIHGVRQTLRVVGHEPA